MAYSDHFILTDDLILHLDPVVARLNDPFIETRYAGFLSVSAVAVLELAVKTIFIEFADNKNKVFGAFCGNYFLKINGQIRTNVIIDKYCKMFGKKYQDKFKSELSKLEKTQFAANRISVKASYENLITWRNDFAHAGNIANLATYNEVKNAYLCGKEVMGCLHKSMRR